MSMFMLCETCEGIFPVYDESVMGRWEPDEVASSGTEQVYVEYGYHPFNMEVYDDHTKLWMCSRCRRNSADSV